MGLRCGDADTLGFVQLGLNPPQTSNASMSIEFDSGVSSKLLELQKQIKYRLILASLDFLNLLSKIQPEEKRCEATYVIRHRGQVAHDITPEPRPNRHQAEWVPGTLDLRAFVEVSQEWHDFRAS